MDLEEAVRKAAQILDDEGARPTSEYHRVYPNLKGMTPNEIMAVSSSQIQEVLPTANLNLPAQRKTKPRPVNEASGAYEYKGQNFKLLKILYSQVAEADRNDFLARLIARISEAKTHKRPDKEFVYPYFGDRVSEVPLITELAIRTGHIAALFKAITQVKVWNASLLFFLMEIEEVIALEFRLLSDDWLQKIPAILSSVVEKARAASLANRNPKQPRLINERNVPQTSHRHFITEMERIVGSINEISKKARYLYVKGELQQQANTEVNADRVKVVAFLVALGFSAQLVESLNAAEREYSSATTSFDFKNSLAHLRSFLEHLHLEAARSISAASGEVLKNNWGGATLFLRTKDCISKHSEEFVTSLYKMISDEGVHPLITEREYARLFRNVVIEYGLMFLATLDKKGVKLNPHAGK